MARITKVEESKRGKLSVYVDGALWKSFEPELVLEMGLHVGRELSPSDMIEIDAESRCLKAYERALAFLSHRSRSVREVRNKLIEVGYDEREAARAISRLIDRGYLDDIRFARDWATSRACGKHYGRRRLKSELAARGVAGEIIDEQLSEICSESEEERRAFEAAKEKLKKMSAVEDAVKRRRVAAFLLRRGYDADIAFRVSKALLRTSPDADQR